MRTCVVFQQRFRLLPNYSGPWYYHYYFFTLGTPFPREPKLTKQYKDRQSVLSAAGKINYYYYYYYFTVFYPPGSNDPVGEKQKLKPS